MEKCLIPNTHRRLEDAHALWHEIIDVYQQPNDFRRKLNDIINALRTTTWMLQKEKHVIKNFDDWYKPLQDKMRSDSYMDWVDSARTEIVHRKDLELHSNSIVKMLNFDETVLAEIKTSAFIKPEEVAEIFLDNSRINHFGFDDGGILEIEKQWIVNEFPESELLRIISHNFEVLSKIVKLAHDKTGVNYYKCEHHELQCSTRKQYLPACMKNIDSYRSLRINLKSKQVENVIFAEGGSGYAIEEICADRGNSIEEDAELIFEHAKKVLVKNGFFDTRVYLYSADDRIVIDPPYESKEDKYLMYKSIAEEAERRDCESVIMISQAKMTEANSSEGGYEIIDGGLTARVLVLSAASINGTEINKMVAFKKNIFGKMIFDSKLNDMYSASIIQYNAFILKPIVDMWSKKKSHEQ